MRLTGSGAVWISASEWGSEGRGFKSHLPDNFLPDFLKEDISPVWGSFIFNMNKYEFGSKL